MYILSTFKARLQPPRGQDSVFLPFMPHLIYLPFSLSRQHVIPILFIFFFFWFFYYGKLTYQNIYHSKHLSVLFIGIKYLIHSYCYATITTVPLQNSLSCKTKDLYLLPTNSPSPESLATLIFLWWLQVLRRNGILQYLSFCDWLISQSIISSRFICIVACLRISFLFKAE